MKVIYVAGKYRANSPNDMFNNIMHARDAARILWLKGWAVICPHANSIFMDGCHTDKMFLKGDLEIIRRCDAIYMLNNYEASHGALVELELAQELGLEIFYER